MHLLTLVAAESALLPSRIQMAFTLAYHVILVPLGVAFPAYTLLMEGIGIFKKDAAAIRIARRWSVVMAVQFAVGAVTGTILSFEFGILWPKLMGRFGAAWVWASPSRVWPSSSRRSLDQVAVGAPQVSVWQACFNPASISFGLVSLAATAFIGASFLVGDARRLGRADMVDYFWRRTVISTAVLIVIGTVALAVIDWRIGPCSTPCLRGWEFHSPPLPSFRRLSSASSCGGVSSAGIALSAWSSWARLSSPGDLGNRRICCRGS